MDRVGHVSVLVIAGLVGVIGSYRAMAGEVPSVSIVAESLCSVRSTKIITMYATVAGLTAPLSFHWRLGNGEEWHEQEVPEQEYEVGRYDVLLAVRDGVGRVKRASVAIEAESQGCGVIR